MNIFRNTYNGLRFKHWTLKETIAYFFKGVARELNIKPHYFLERYEKIATDAFNRKWLHHNGDEKYFDFNGVKIPANLEPNFFKFLRIAFDEIFLFSCFYNDNYDKDFVSFTEKYVMEDIPYCYKDNNFNVTVEKGDVVIDAGAWIGDFSAYAASKGAMVYSFEPEPKLYELLSKTKKLNPFNEEERIFPIKKALGSHESKMNLSIDSLGGGAANSLVIHQGVNETVSVDVVSLDTFVDDNKIRKVDFIKADIEGAERDMLKGAIYVLKTFAPKLSICTYHLPDDPTVIEEIILDANPNYKIIHFRKKLFAAVTK